MTDMLVNLLHLPEVNSSIRQLQEQEIMIRRPIAPEQSIVTKWVRDHFSEGWASEVMVSFHHQPVSCFVAQRNNQILGFACYEATCKNYFGPTGVLEEARGLGLGKILLVRSLEALRELGYAYAIIGGVGPVEFYKKAVGAEVIEGSESGIYTHMLKQH